MQKSAYFLALTIALAFPAHAEDIRLTADDKVEWHQNEQKMVAVGNAIATKKDMNIRADQMTAFYESSKKGGEKPAPTSAMSMRKAVLSSLRLRPKPMAIQWITILSQT